MDGKFAGRHRKEGVLHLRPSPPTKHRGRWTAVCDLVAEEDVASPSTHSNPFHYLVLNSFQSLPLHHLKEEVQCVGTVPGFTDP